MMLHSILHIFNFQYHFHIIPTSQRRSSGPIPITRFRVVGCTPTPPEYASSDLLWVSHGGANCVHGTTPEFRDSSTVVVVGIEIGMTLLMMVMMLLLFVHSVQES
mmetsp:Transcript_12658/g.18176  ORF Transcript_12658/g.18176 Transcript_12658/m.18176 type:complete len:105 (-) Transcript_12658:89-403(-)